MPRYKYGKLSIDLERQMLRYQAPWTVWVRLFVYCALFWGVLFMIVRCI